MERAGFMTCTAASHQGAITEPAASLSRTSETHPLWTGAEQKIQILWKSASASIYSVGAGASDSIEHLIEVI